MAEGGNVHIELTQLAGRVDGIEQRVNYHQVYIDTTSRPILEEVRTFMSNIKVIEKEREKVNEDRHRENSFKLNIMMALIAFAALVATIAGIMVTVYYAKHAELIPHDLFGRQYMQQDAQDSQVPDYGVTR
jgi:hypothetical protein